MVVRIKSGYRVSKSGKVVKSKPKLSVSAKLRQASSKKVRVVKTGKGT